MSTSKRPYQQLTEAELWALYVVDHAEAVRDELAHRFLPLLRSCAGHLFSRLKGRVEFKELCGDGYFGLLSALKSFDPAKGNKFNAYGKCRITGSMLDAIRNRDPLPRLMRKRGNCPLLVSISNPVGEGNSRIVRIADLLKAPDSAMADLELNDWFSHALQGFTHAEQLILRLYYRENFNMKEIGRVLDLSESRISQMHSSIIPRLRAKLTPIAEKEVA